MHGLQLSLIGLTDGGNCWLTVHRMGGPRAWKEMQKRQQGFQSGWDEVPTNNDSDDNDDEAWDGEKRDLYAEYDIDPETENEKEQRGGGDTGEDPGQEDVGFMFFGE
jgi:Swi5-dependent recombination DNA repair protein 1